MLTAASSAVPLGSATTQTRSASSKMRIVRWSLPYDTGSASSPYYLPCPRSRGVQLLLDENSTHHLPGPASGASFLQSSFDRWYREVECAEWQGLGVVDAQPTAGHCVWDVHLWMLLCQALQMRHSTEASRALRRLYSPSFLPPDREVEIRSHRPKSAQYPRISSRRVLGSATIIAIGTSTGFYGMLNGMCCVVARLSRCSMPSQRSHP